MPSVRKEFVIQNDLTRLDALAEGLLQFCKENGLPDQLAYNIRLVVEEAVCNTIKYGYEDQDIHTISVIAELEGGEIRLEIQDDARPFNPNEAPAPDLSVPIEEREIGGLGIFLMRAFMDEINYQRSSGRNILRMQKSL